MTVFVDELTHRGMSYIPGRVVRSCHMLTDDITCAELHKMAQEIGMNLKWFQPLSSPHYDLMVGMRTKAVAAGAVEVSSRQIVAVRKQWMRDWRAAGMPHYWPTTGEPQ